jgi:hypothetical protein
MDVLLTSKIKDFLFSKYKIKIKGFFKEGIGV